MTSSRRGLLRGIVTTADISPFSLLYMKVGTSLVKRSDGNIEQYLKDNRESNTSRDRQHSSFVYVQCTGKAYSRLFFTNVPSGQAALENDLALSKICSLWWANSPSARNSPQSFLCEVIA